MKPLEVLAAVPQWAGASADQILDSPAFAMPCRLGEEQVKMVHADVAPADTIDLSVSFGSEPHTLSIAKSGRFPELGVLWDSRADIPAPILLALVEKECGPLLQLLENAVRAQLKLVGLEETPSVEAGATPEDAGAAAPQKARVDFRLSAPSGGDEIVFSITRSPTLVSAFGNLRNIDLSHESVRSLVLNASVEYAAFAMGTAEISTLTPGDVVLLPEIGAVAPRILVDGSLVVEADGVMQGAADALAHVRAVAARTITLGEVLDASAGNPPPPASIAALDQLILVVNGKTVASGHLGKLADQQAFIVEA